MPLKSGSSEETISENIARLRRENYSSAQAAAIAYKEAGKDEGDGFLHSLGMELSGHASGNFDDPLNTLSKEVTGQGVEKGSLAKELQDDDPDNSGGFEQKHPILSEVAGHAAEALGMLESKGVFSQSPGKVYSVEKISNNQELTPEGFLLCKNTPIARTGSLVYDARELNELEAGRNGLILVGREPHEVFHPDAMASFVGKSITDEHPDDLVSPETYRQNNVGTILSVRRGEGADSDVLLADLLICDASAIKAVQTGKRELSCGYNADYEQEIPGRAVQRNIRGNHVALVEQGRCGPRCSIRDKQMAQAPTTTKNWKDRLLGVLQSRDKEIKDCLMDADTEESEKKEGTRDVHIHVNKSEDSSTSDASWRKSVDDSIKAMKDMLEEMIAKKGQMAIGEPELPPKPQPPVIVDPLPAAAQAQGAADEKTVPVENTDESKKEEEEEEEALKQKAQDEAKEKSEEGKFGEGKEEEKEAKTKDSVLEPSHTGTSGQGGGGGAPPGSSEYGSNAGPKQYGPTGQKTSNPSKGNDAEAEEEFEAKGTNDSLSLLYAWNDTIARAEKLSPGLKAPTFDSKATPKTTKDSLCLFRRRALAAAFDGASADIVKPLVVSKQKVTDLSCDAIRIAFIASSDEAGRANNDRHRGSGADETPAERSRNVLADMNKRNREAWNQK